jgi:hypothetical protein
MLGEDRASVEAVLDERDPSKLRIDIRVRPIGGGSFGSEAREIQRAYRQGFRDGLQEAEFKRQARGSNPQRKWRGWLASVLGFFLCVGLGSAATFLLTATHPRSTAVAATEDLGSAVASPGSQSDLAPPPFVRPEPSQLRQLQSSAAGGAAASEPGPGVFGLHQQ